MAALHLVAPRCCAPILFSLLSAFGVAEAVAQQFSMPSDVAIGDPLVLQLSGLPPGAPYWIDASLFGAAPGMPLAGSNRVIPANRPFFFADFRTALHPSTFVGCLGLADANGRASATLHLDEQPGLAGLQLACFGAVIDPRSPDLLGGITQRRLVNITPAAGTLWTEFRPSVDSRIVHVSTAGNDANDGLSPSRPVRTVARGKSLVRHGYPDWLVFRRGDVFDTPIGSWTAGGRSASEPIVIGSYGTAAERPLFRTGSASGITFTGGGVAPPTMDHVAIVGLEFYANGRDPASPSYVGAGSWPVQGVLYLRPGQNLHIEDCAFRMFSSNIVVQAEGAGLQGLTIRRCVLMDGYGVTNLYYGHGIYMYNAHGVLIEENVIDRNGWDNGPGLQASIFTHNVYLQPLNSGVVMQRNIIARGGSHGVQMRCGGVVADNLFVRNAISVLVGGEVGSSLTGNAVTGNVILNGSDISPTTPRGWAIDVSRVPDITVSDNLVVQNNGHQPVGMRFTEVGRADVVQNTLVSWDGGNLLQSAALPGYSVDRNILSQGTMFASNRLASTVPFGEASRTLAAFDARLGGNGTVENFLAEARRQSRTRWLPAYTARAVQVWMAQGFRPATDLGWPQVGAVPYR